MKVSIESRSIVGSQLYLDIKILCVKNDDDARASLRYAQRRFPSKLTV
jgi:hypothetical protein